MIKIDQEWSISIEKRSKSLNYIQNLIEIEIAIVNSNLSLDFESDRNWRSKLGGLESESSTIRCRTPNHISLQIGDVKIIGQNWPKKNNKNVEKMIHWLKNIPQQDNLSSKLMLHLSK